MRIALSLLVVASALTGLAAPSAAAPLPIRNASLSIRISNLAEFEIPRVGPSTFNGTGTRTDTELLALAFPLNRFAVSTIETPVDVDLVGGLGLSDVRNDGGNFAAGGGGFGGTMAIRGYAWVCLFAACDFSPFPDQALSLPLDVVGVGGSEFGDFGALEVTLVGNGWTTGQAAVGADSETGFMGPAPGGGGFLAVRLVTPISIATSLDPPNQLIPAFGILEFEVPEPETLGLGLAATGTLLAVGLARRRG